MDQDIAYEINVVQHKYSNDPNFEGKPIFLKFCKTMLTIRTQYFYLT